MTKIAIRIDDGQVRAALNALIRAGADLTPAMREISELLREEAAAAFEKEAAPDGAAWAPLSPVTVALRKKIGKGPRPILQITGGLVNSLTRAHGADFAAAGTNKIYAATQQFGAAKGEFGATARGAPIPWGDIPARPFLGLSAEGAGDVVRILQQHLLEVTQ